ncbi:MAG: hypothetical protein HY783_06235, partial [Chloroflexi bacterium]|nr:hypothetical protein [Chloroflexota bacterium]
IGMTLNLLGTYVGGPPAAGGPVAAAGALLAGLATGLAAVGLYSGTKAAVLDREQVAGSRGQGAASCYLPSAISHWPYIAA